MVYLRSFYCKMCGARWDILGNEINFEYVDFGCECEDTIREYQKGLDIFGLKAIYARSHH